MKRKKQFSGEVNKQVACHECGSIVTVLGGSYIDCPMMKKRIPVMSDGTPHNRTLNGAGQSAKITGRTASGEEVYAADPDDERFRVTRSDGWYFVPEGCKCLKDGAA